MRGHLADAVVLTLVSLVIAAPGAVALSLVFDAPDWAVAGFTYLIVVLWRPE